MGVGMGCVKAGMNVGEPTDLLLRWVVLPLWWSVLWLSVLRLVVTAVPIQSQCQPHRSLIVPSPLRSAHGSYSRLWGSLRPAVVSLV